MTNKTLDQVRTELWQSCQKYAKACIDLGLSEEYAIEKFVQTPEGQKADQDTLIIIKCAIAFGYSHNQ